MIKSVTVVNYIGDTLKMELRNPEKSGFLIYDIQGITPPQANINTSEMAMTDGSIFNSSRLESRNVTLSLKYMWKPDIETMRHLSYKYFPIKREVMLIFETDYRTSYCTGFVESNEISIFSQQEVCQISIICPDPYLYQYGREGTVSTTFSGITELFEFPFSNESTTENLLQMGEITQFRQKNVIYKGDIEVGVTIKMHALGQVKNFRFYNLDTREMMSIDDEKFLAMTGSYITTGDEIEICTERGNKYVHLLRAGITTNILNALVKGADWFKLNKGDNQFAYIADEGQEYISLEMINKIAYEGV